MVLVLDKKQARKNHYVGQSLRTERKEVVHAAVTSL